MNSIEMKNFLGQYKMTEAKNFHRSDLLQNRRSIFELKLNDEKQLVIVSMKVSKSNEFVRWTMNEDDEVFLSLIFVHSNKTNDSTRFVDVARRD